MIVVAGANGMLGRAFRELLERRGTPHRALSRADCDITSPASIERAIGPSAIAVVNCAAYTDVDGAEKDELHATAINGEAVGHLARHCDAIGATLVHFGTDYVFDGRGDRPYPIDYPTAPINAYGRSKLAGELALRTGLARHLLIRTSWVYAPWGKNFVRTIAELAKARPSLRVVNDQRGRPTSAEHLAEASLALLSRESRGTYHLTDGGDCTWFELAREVARASSSSCEVSPCTTAEFPRPAPRPAYSVLDLTRTEAELGPMPHWRDAVAGVVHKLMST